ncbi:MAG: PorT family protein [Bacteroidetes bacterium]|nr:PorT family protein [Bacteroidota bacterium]
MKKYLTLIILLLFLGINSIAQQFHGGVMAGLVGSQVAGDTWSGYKKAGIFAGGYVNLDIGTVSAIQFELTYFQKGSRENPTEKNGYQSYLLRLNYIEMPILYQYKAGRFTIEAGPSAGFLMGYYESVNQEVISDQQHYIKPARVTLQINLGFQFALTPKIGVDFRTNNSLLNIYSQKQSGDFRRFFDHGRYNDSLVLSMFYKFR